MKDGKICYGLAGLGMGGQTHARELSKVPGARLAAVYGRDKDKARTFAKRFDVLSSDHVRLARIT